VLDAKIAQGAGSLQCNRCPGLLLGDASQQIRPGLLLEERVRNVLILAPSPYCHPPQLLAPRYSLDRHITRHTSMLIAF
jgi:hypothetical protein